MALSHFDILKIAKPYANALFNTAIKVEKQTEIANDLANYLEIAPKLQALAQSPVISRIVKIKIFTEIMHKNDASEIVRNFFILLAKNNRLEITTQIIEYYNKLLSEHNNEIKVSLISAENLDKKQINFIANAIGNKTAKQVITTNIIQPDILGGVMIKFGSKLLDFSLKGKMQRISETLKI